MKETLSGNAPGGAKPPAAEASAGATDVETLIQEMQQLMWSKAGIVRSRQGLSEALQCLTAMAGRLPGLDSRRHMEARNLHTASLLIVRSALARLESRGAHYRVDCPEHDDAKFKKHSVVTQQSVRFQ
jgi:succinate dehydrogenase/fumarate reductase flavoprotein subunit